MSIRQRIMLLAGLGGLAMVALLLGGCRSGRQVGEAPELPGDSAPVTVDETGTTTAEVGQSVPSFVVTDIDGKSHTPGDYKGKIMVLEFWATYCKPCVEKLREFEVTQQTLKDRGVVFLGLSMDESDAIIKGWREENDATIPLARVDDKTRQLFFGDSALVSIPQVRLVDRKGTIRYSYGPEGTVEQVEKDLQTLLAEE